MTTAYISNFAQPETMVLQGSITPNATLSIDDTHWVAFKFNSGAITGAQITDLTRWLAATGNAGDTALSNAYVYSDSGGVPGTAIGSFANLAGAAIGSGVTPIETVKNAFGPSPSTDYWLVFYLSAPVAGTYTVSYDNTGGFGIIATSSDTGATWATQNGTGCWQIGSGSIDAADFQTDTARAVWASTKIGTAVYADVDRQTGTAFYAYLTAAASAALVVRADNAAATDALVQIQVTGLQAGVDIYGDGHIYATSGYATAVDHTSAGNAAIQHDHSGYQRYNCGTLVVDQSSKTVELPDATKMGGREFVIVNNAGVTATTVTSAGGTINGASTDTSLAAAYNAGRYQSDFVNWFKV